MMRGDVVQERDVEVHGRRSGSCKPRIRVLISSLLVVSLYHLIYRGLIGKVLCINLVVDLIIYSTVSPDRINVNCHVQV